MYIFIFRSKTSLSASVSLKKSFLQPLLHQSTQSTSYSPETVQYDSVVGSNVRYITHGQTGEIHTQQLSAAPPHPSSAAHLSKRGNNIYTPASVSYNSSNASNNLSLSNVSGMYFCMNY